MNISNSQNSIWIFAFQDFTQQYKKIKKNI